MHLTTELAANLSRDELVAGEADRPEPIPRNRIHRTAARVTRAHGVVGEGSREASPYPD